jgi:hypothetical protein
MSRGISNVTVLVTWIERPSRDSRYTSSSRRTVGASQRQFSTSGCRDERAFAKSF